MILKTKKKVLGNFLTIFAMFALGFLSFTGAYALFPSLIFAGLSFFLAALVEGQIYRQNIFESFLQLQDKEAIARQMLLPYLKDFILDEKLKKDCVLLQDYARLSALIENDQAFKNYNAAQQKKILKQHYKIETFLIRLILKKEKTEHLNFDSSIFLQQLPNNFSNKIRHKENLNRYFIKPLVFLAALSWMLTCLSTSLMGVLLLLPVLTPFLPALIAVSIFPAALVAIAFYFVMYKSAVHIITEDVIQTFFKKANSALRPKQDENLLVYLVRYNLNLFKYSFLFVLGALLTLATFGTWWFAVRQAAALLPILRRIPTLVTAILVPSFALITAIFNFDNALESLSVLANTSLFQTIKKMALSIKKHYEEESLLEFINPFRIASKIISLPFNCVLLALHLFSIAVTLAQSVFLPKVVSTSAGLVNEGLTDFHYLNPEAPAEEDSVPELVIKILLLPLNTLSLAWASFARKLAHKKEPCKTEDYLGFKFEKKSEAEKPHQKMPELSELWQKIEWQKKLSDPKNANKANYAVFFKPAPDDKSLNLENSVKKSPTMGF